MNKTAKDIITCDECGARIGPRQKSVGWQNLLTAEAQVCEECWDTEMTRVLTGVESYAKLTSAIMDIKFPIRTFIGKVIEEDNAVKTVMERFGVSKT